ncbi:MAG TPA: glycosyltransferase family 39 protein [Candidatus Binatia bacterium]|nr:glycosyltransferase family 39 protein [Candidatus Binatia bacterium]
MKTFKLGRSEKLVLVIWICFVVRGCFYCALLPMWEGYDEPFHFAFIQHVAAGKGLPVPTTPVSREVQESLHLVPLSWQERLHALAPPIYSEDSYWQLTKAERKNLQQQVRALPPEWGMQPGTAPALYEAQQAPLYYWIMAVPFRLVAEWPLAARVLFLRVASVLLASLVIPLAYAAAGRFFAGDTQASAIVAVIACMPELMIDISRVGNESLAIPVYSLLTLLLLRAVQRGGSRWFVAAGVVLGAGLLTKAYFVFAIPALLATGAYSAWQGGAQRRRIIFNTALGTVLAVLISFAWYWRNHLVTGTWSGEQDAAIAAHGTVSHVVGAVGHVHWTGAIASVLISHIWFGGWSFLKLPRFVYAVFVLGMGAAVVGLAKAVLGHRLRPGQLVVPLALYGFFWVGLLCDVLAIYIARGVSASCGWYLYALIVPEVLLVTCGLYALAPEVWRWTVLPGMTVAFAALDLYGAHALLVPYYTGLISHPGAGDLIRPAGLSDLVNAGPHLLLARLTANRPAFLSPEMMALLLLAWYAATAVCVAISYSAMRRHRRLDQPEMAATVIR